MTRIDSKSLPFGGTWTYDVQPASDGRTKLQITEDGEVYNPIFRFVSRFFIGYEGTLRQYVADVERTLKSADGGLAEAVTRGRSSAIRK